MTIEEAAVRIVAQAHPLLRISILWERGSHRHCTIPLLTASVIVRGRLVLHTASELGRGVLRVLSQRVWTTNGREDICAGRLAALRQLCLLHEVHLADNLAL